MSDFDLSKAQPGDILLYHGTEHFINRAINYLDNAYYSHASIFLGGNKVQQATVMDGVHHTSIEKSAKGYSNILIKRLRNSPSSLIPVFDEAEELLGRKYDISQVLLLGMLLSTKKIEKYNNEFARFAISILNSLSQSMYNFIGNTNEKLVCSELPYRCYNDAVSDFDDPYTIVLERNSRKPLYNRMKKVGVMNEPHYETGSLMSRFYGSRISRPNGISPFVETSFNIKSTKIEEVAVQINKSNFSVSEENKILDEIERGEEKNTEKLFEDYVNSDGFEISNNLELQLKKSLDDFILFNSGYINFSKEKEFFVPVSYKQKRTRDALRKFLSVRNEFVTAKDLNKSVSLENIGFII